MDASRSKPGNGGIIAAAEGLAWDGRCLRFDGEPQILVGGSVFYFRLAREDWAGRLAMVKAAGYNAVDVYFPWNFHEITEGEWDFTGRRDAAHFLDLVHAVGLKAIARPGPYICSEWEGGGLPAWLIGKNLDLRQNDPAYLEYVGRWFDRIIPILVERQ
ncbi:MAG: beta-galactosidase, partial [Bacteroidota bacterium]